MHRAFIWLGAFALLPVSFSGPAACSQSDSAPAITSQALSSQEKEIEAQRVCCVPAQDRKLVNDSDIAVIVNPGNPVDSISSTELRKIFSGQKQSWSGGLRVDLFVRAPSAREREVLLGQVLKMSESEYKAFWVKKVYSGETQREPLALFSNGMQLEAVRAEKGGIALVSLQDLHQGVKVLKINGRLPGTPGYTLE